MTHVDEWIEMPTGDKGEDYARFVLHHARLPAIMQVFFEPWTKQFRLFCTHKRKRYKVTGASRLGDVWLAKDLTRESGYDLRVDLADCSKWGPLP
jgi:hypothetical protein